MTTTNDIREYLLANSPWVDRENTVDTVKYGDPEKPIRKAAVCWYPCTRTIWVAYEQGCQLIITHEPLFWDHWGKPDEPWRKKEPGLTRLGLLEKTGMVVLRAHDSWDNWPEIGIRDAWARGLGLEKRIHDGPNLRWNGMYAINPQPLKVFARHIADRIRPLGEDSVQVMGDPDRIVSRPSVGVGCGVPDMEMVDAGSDVLIMCYDGASYWSRRERIFEAGAAIITVEHGTSEMWGIEALSNHLASQFRDIDFVYLAEHPRTWTVQSRQETS